MIFLILCGELSAIILWYLIHTLIVASSLPLLTEQSIFHTRSFGIDTYFPKWITWFLLQCVDVNKSDCNMTTALHYACMWDDYDKIRILLTYGAQQNIGTYTPLDIAIGRGNLKIITLLLKHTIPDHPRYTTNLDVLGTLLQNGCHPNNFIGQAMKHHHREVLMLLIDYGADQNRLMGYDPVIDAYMLPTVKGAEDSLL